MEESALPVGVQAAAVLVLPLVGRVLARGEIEEHPVARRLIGLDAGPADPFGEHAGHGQSVVADQLSVEPEPALPCQPAVARVAQPHFLGNDRRLAVGPGHHDHLEHFLDVPASPLELERQPIQQLGMRRPGSLGSEVVERLHQPLAEGQLPEPVDHDAGRERIVAGDQPPRQVEACRPAVRDTEWWERGGDAGGHDRPRFIEPVAARQHADGPRLDRGRSQRVGEFVSERVELIETPALCRLGFLDRVQAARSSSIFLSSSTWSGVVGKNVGS